MIYKKIKNSTLVLPAIGQGVGAYQWNDGHIPVIQAGLELGMNFIDTAEEYDGGHSEEIIGRAVRGRREKIIIGTKFSSGHNGYNDILKCAEDSLRRLQTDYIDLYQIHWPNPDIPVEETLRAMEKLVTDGKVRFIGVCNFLLQELQKAKSILVHQKLVSLQGEYNLFDRSLENGMIPFCQTNDMFVIAYSPLDKGKSADRREGRALLAELSEKYNKTASQLALRWLISKEPVVVIPKAVKIEHVKQNAGSADFTLEKDDLEKIDLAFKRPILLIPPKDIRVTLEGEGSRLTYTTLEEARENKLNFIPGPQALAGALKADQSLKPVRLIHGEDGRYILVEGRIRYWAWVLAFGEEKPIPAYLREN